MDTPEDEEDRQYYEERRRRHEAQHKAWVKEERINRITGCLIIGFLLLALISGFIRDWKAEQLPIEEQEARMKAHMERMDHMFR
jgi:hypothetical protein